jgi:hypothetical protein
MLRLSVFRCAMLLSCLLPFCNASAVTPVEGFYFIDTGFENASPVNWTVDEDHTIQIHLLYDYERVSPNRAAGHWYFKLEAAPGTQWTIVFNNLENVWNSRVSSPASDRTTCSVSADGKAWRVLQTELLEGNRLQVKVTVEAGTLYVARLEPYTLAHLLALKQRLSDCPYAEITDMGKTVQGRTLEMIRMGDPAAPHSIVIRCRAHPWEPGGNWVVDGLLDRLAQDNTEAIQWRKQFCIYVMPMANKDGVVLGRTRFNLLGEDLNRKWDKPSDPELAPEKYALEQWLTKMITAGRRPDLLIDFHNDQGGRLHISRPPIENLEAYLQRMEAFEAALRAHTWFTEGSTKASFRNPGSIGEGVLLRYGIPAVVHELNANHIAGIDKPAQAKHWQAYGASLPKVFAVYFSR